MAAFQRRDDLTLLGVQALIWLRVRRADAAG